MQLADWIKKSGGTVPAFAAAIGATPRSVFRYISGSRYPTSRVLQAIYKATEGAVTANDFHQQESKPNAPIRRRAARSVAR